MEKAREVIMWHQTIPTTISPASTAKSCQTIKIFPFYMISMFSYIFFLFRFYSPSFYLLTIFLMTKNVKNKGNNIFYRCYHIIILNKIKEKKNYIKRTLYSSPNTSRLPSILCVVLVISLKNI